MQFNEYFESRWKIFAILIYFNTKVLSPKLERISNYDLYLFKVTNELDATFYIIIDNTNGLTSFYNWDNRDYIEI
jgi:hypothetical protein